MSRAITLRYQYTLEDAQCAAALHFKRSCPPAVRILMYLLSLGLLVCGAYDSFYHGHQQSLVFVIGGLYWPFLRPLERRWRVWHHFRNRQDRETNWVISEESLKVVTEDGKAEMKWGSVIRGVQAPVGLLLYTSKDLFHLLPRRAFIADADFQWLADLAKAKVQKFETVT